MTNTLHRYSEHYAVEGRADVPPVDDDYIVFAMSSRNLNDDDLVEKYRTFAKLALRHSPVNIGDATKGGIYRPEPHLTPLAHWRRDQRPDPERVINDVEGHTTMSAVFSSFEDMGIIVMHECFDISSSCIISAGLLPLYSCPTLGSK